MRIKTRKLAATESEPARIRVRAENGAETTVPYDHGSNTPHADAAKLLAGEQVVVEHGYDAYGYTFRTA